MTDREKQSLKIRLGKRLSSDRPEVMEIVKEEINKTPKTIADLLQRPIGEWKVIHNALGETKYQCNQCQHFAKPSDDKNFCPNCGAKMKGGAE